MPRKYLIEKELLYTDAETSPSADAARKDAEDRAKLMFILEKIADQDGLEVSQEEINARTRALAGGHGMSFASFRGVLAAGNRLGRLADSLLAEKVLAYLSDGHTNMHEYSDAAKRYPFQMIIPGNNHLEAFSRCLMVIYLGRSESSLGFIHRHGARNVLFGRIQLKSVWYSKHNELRHGEYASKFPD